MNMDNLNIAATVFPERNRRLEVIFVELLQVASKQAMQQPNNRELIDLLNRAKAIAASFPKQ
jgi:hypothetical protein